MKFSEKLERPSIKTVKLTATIPWSEVEAAKTKALTELQKTTEVTGFRKGKAPEKLVLEKIGEEKLLEEASRYFLGDLYVELIKKHDLKPAIDPKIKLMKAPKGGEWEIVFEVAEEPEIKNIPDYRKIAEKVKGESKKDEIWVPGKDVKAPSPEETAKKQEEKKNLRLQKIFNELVEKSEIQISSLIMDEEINRRLVNLYEEIKKLGISIEQYLETKKETAESLRVKISREVIDIYKSEFILERIAEEEKITVEEKDTQKIIDSAKTPEEKDAFKKNAYFYSRILRKQKTLDFLANL